MSDAASNLMIAARDAVKSYEGLRNNTNTSNTALAQSQVAGTVTQGNLTAAMAAVDGISGGEGGGGGLRTRDRPARSALDAALAERVAAQQQAEITFAAHQAGLDARRETLREGLLFQDSRRKLWREQGQ